MDDDHDTYLDLEPIDDDVYEHIDFGKTSLTPSSPTWSSSSSASEYGEVTNTHHRTTKPPPQPQYDRAEISALMEEQLKEDSLLHHEQPQFDDPFKDFDKPMHAGPPLSAFRPNTLTRQKRLSNLRLLPDRRLTPCDESFDSFYDLDQWDLIVERERCKAEASVADDSYLFPPPLPLPPPPPPPPSHHHLASTASPHPHHLLLRASCNAIYCGPSSDAHASAAVVPSALPSHQLLAAVIATSTTHDDTAMDDDELEMKLVGDPMEDGMAGESNSSREMKVFKRVLRDSCLRAPFEQFLTQQFCAENINFYTSVEAYHDMFYEPNVKSQADRHAFARDIYNRHFAPNSMEPVNVDNSTSKKIRDLVSRERFPRTLFDVAQYQIFHLLKYDCWPRFLRAGGSAPDFTDEELAEDDQPRQEASEDVQQAECSTSSRDEPCGSKKGGWASQALSSPANSCSKQDKRKSLLWHGLDRFSRKLKQVGLEGGSGARSSGGAGSPCESRGVHRSSSTRGSNADAGPRRSYSSEIENEAPAERMVVSAGSRRRQMFASGGKQYSMPAEISHPGSPYPARSQPRVCKYCTLMSAESANSETIELNDPSISVGKWTQNMASLRGMDKKATEAVDAQTGSTIDPCRQAIDALQNRFVRLVPVVTFAVEILPPNFSFKNPASTPSKVIMVRARHSLSVGAVLRPLLNKYSLDFTQMCAVFSGTLDAIRHTVTIGNVGSRTLTVMLQTQLNERQSSAKREMPRDPMAAQPSLLADVQLQFHQHGDISYCELPGEGGRMNKTEHSLGMIKFLRKASAAVTSKEEPGGVSRNKASGSRRKSTGQGSSVYCGEEQEISPPPAKDKETKKRLSIFKNNKGRDTPTSSTPGKESPLPCRTPRLPSAASSPVPQRAQLTSTPATSSTLACGEHRDANGDTPRTPAIYASVVLGNGEEAETRGCGWQPAAYV